MANVYIISSSPPARDLSIFDMPPSSPLPSVKDILKKKPKALQTGSRAAPIPQYATATFTSAATLLQIAPSEDLESNKDEDSAKSAKPKRRKVVAKKVDNGEAKVAKPKKVAVGKAKVDGVEEVKKPRKSKPTVVEGAEDGAVITKALPARKSRAKKAEKKTEDETVKEKPGRKTKAKKDTESQTRLPKGKVTKASTASSKKVASKVGPDPFQDSLNNGLVEAVRRRITWTPPPQSGMQSFTTPVDVGLLDGSVSASSLFSEEKSKGFTDLLGKFGFTKAEGNVQKPTTAVEAVRKRKLIELVKTSAATVTAASPEKVPKKKPRTLTDLATSAYAKEEELPQAVSAPLLQYFSLQATEWTTSDGFKIPSKPRSKSPVKRGSKVKKGSAQAPILLSPESAMKQVGRQDFVFGTSSQLAREDSPTLLRDLHEAMQASNVADVDPFAEQLTESVSQTLSNRGVSNVSAKRNLWSAASRDIAGNLQSVELVDLINTPIATRTGAPQPAIDILTSVIDEDNDFWHDVEEINQTLTQNLQQIESLSQADPKEISTGRLWASLTERPILTDPSQESILPASSQPPTVSQAAPEAAKKPAKTKQILQPDFSSYTTAQLAKEIASYRFKPIKSRDQMILLLEKCWEGKNRTALAALGTNTAPVPRADTSKTAFSTHNQMEASPKRPRGRPRKDSTTVSPAKTKPKTTRRKSLDTVEYLEMDSDTPLSQLRTPKKSQKRLKEPVEDIFDPESIMTPSPPRRKGSPKRTKALTLKISSSVSDASLELSPTSSQRLLFRHITSAVTNAPSAKNSTNPSWHEKILLYDPIILEDLTVWLNTGALEKAGWDGEVDPKEVKKWCESKSICCLWKENLRGGTRSRH
ncbi:5'-flap endonuclease [Cadophora gregata]|uniref:5'-flap endonuclease n=1 Tax=Cadophora gregata TaxID=51156 RepID=UPI0026DC06B8|nr:5'-flap endonuclease [Cadophora gregata]KAK0115513.1 5'-flap endonuclease [Cadophora gregata f. sp. sojae]KAK0128231.1 5'-flap endonuclease [Cadophora gregata]